jgi:hypothetical protein
MQIVKDFYNLHGHPLLSGSLQETISINATAKSPCNFAVALMKNHMISKH